MPRWKRTGNYLAKSRSITDGELLHLLTGKASDVVSEFDKAVYASLQNVKSASFRSLLSVVAFAALGILAHFNMITGASAAGLQLAPAIFTHVALIGGSLTGAWFCFNFTKQSFLQAWFSWKLRVATPALKAELLLLFPDAYWYFSYLPANVGYPPFHFARRSGWLQLVYLLLILVVLLVGAFGSIGLWVALARDVLSNSQISHRISILTVVSCAAMTLLGWLSPFRYDFPQRYTHMGLVTLLNNRVGERNAEAHRRVALIAARMGLIEL